MKVIIRSSMLRDYENMSCAKQFQARWFPRSQEEADLMSLDNIQAIRWGQYFEQIVLGSGVDGKTIELTPEEIRSVYYKRIKQQAEVARKYIFKDLGLQFMLSQARLEAVVQVDGIDIPIEGHIDGISGDNGVPKLVLDTKYTGDTKNTFGDYSWGKPESMDMIQLVIYLHLVRVNYSSVTDLEGMYYVADSKVEMNVSVITPEFSDEYTFHCFQRIKEAYLNISNMVRFNHFPASPEFNKCKNCPLFKICKDRADVPEKQIIYK